MWVTVISLKYNNMLVTKYDRSSHWKPVIVTPDLVLFKWAIGLTLFEQLRFNFSIVFLRMKIISYTGWISLYRREHLLEHASSCGWSGSLPHEERISPSPVGFTRSPGKKKHFEPFYISKTLLHCVGSPDWNNFSFSNSFYRFLMHLCILDSPKNTSWIRVGAFFGGRRGWDG